MSFKFGFQGRLFIDSTVAAGNGSCTCTAATHAGTVKNLTLNIERADSDATVRSSTIGTSRIRVVVGSMITATLEFEFHNAVVSGPSYGFALLRQSFEAGSGTFLKMAVMDGSQAASEGLDADWEVVGMSREQPISEIEVYKFTCKPVLLYRNPSWRTFATAIAGLD